MVSLIFDIAGTSIGGNVDAGDAIVVVFGVSMTSTVPNFCGVLVVPSTGGVATTASGCAIGEWFCDNGKQRCLYNYAVAYHSVSWLFLVLGYLGDRWEIMYFSVSDSQMFVISHIYP
ncbi:hypothetical protein D9757_009839 [Collybiopsis confluens]|uniref:Uncharacterized protein n=1 Tax=Collybiopsis confluens TaxID=2823264 RepID=A0A8H5M241_9AGAR|nr:hypothetical protein D9757_009839 [Collybiopsis confluens]